MFEEMAMGTVTLKMYNGKEVFKIKDALIIANQRDSGISIWMEYSTEDEPILRDTELLDSQGCPNADITFKINNIKELSKCKIRIPLSYDEELSDYVSRFYYYEHNDIDKNIIEIRHKSKNVYNVKWTGLTDDVNFYDGSKPRTRVVVDGEFILQDYEKWFF